MPEAIKKRSSIAINLPDSPPFFLPLSFPTSFSVYFITLFSSDISLLFVSQHSIAFSKSHSKSHLPHNESKEINMALFNPVTDLTYNGRKRISERKDSTHTHIQHTPLFSHPLRKQPRHRHQGEPEKLLQNKKNSLHSPRPFNRRIIV